MNQLLNPGELVQMQPTELSYKVEEFLGGGGQGEVYRARLVDGQGTGSLVALKWFFPHYLRQDRELRARLERAVDTGPPSDRFLWPQDLVQTADRPGFGYVMPLRDNRFVGIIDLVTRRAEPTLHALVTAAFELAHNYRQLHAKGFCYRDISFGNVFFDPESGEVRICDNDNVGVDGQGGAIGGTARFMAPEIVRGEAAPSTQTDLFSLAVLLFYMLVNHHPLEGAREAQIRCFDLPAMTRLYGTDPLFIFDPDDDSNRPLFGNHDNALALWPLYPGFVQELFVRAFTDGLRQARSSGAGERVGQRADSPAQFHLLLPALRCRKFLRSGRAGSGQCQLQVLLGMRGIISLAAANANWPRCIDAQPQYLAAPSPFRRRAPLRLG